MKLFMQFNVLVSILLAFASPASSKEVDQPIDTETIMLGTETRIPLAAPSEVCFRQSSLIGDLDNMTLQHYLMVMPEHVEKTGRVFVGARLKNQPGVTWLTGGGNFWVEDRGNDVIPYPLSYGYSSLQPIIPVTVFHKPVNLEDFVDDGEIWAGYGLWPEEGPDNYHELAHAGKIAEIFAWRQRAAYEEMLASERFRKIWTAGEYTEADEICMKVTELMKRKAFTVGHQLVCPSPLGCGEDVPALDLQ